MAVGSIHWKIRFTVAEGESRNSEVTEGAILLLRYIWLEPT